MASANGMVELPSQILIVDDEPVVIELLRELLGGPEREILSEETGEKAVERLESTPVACLLVDKNLPGIDGLEVLRCAREKQPHCACIVMTAFSSTESAVKALRLGANDYLEKPFEDLDLVAEKVENAIRNQRAQFERDELYERVRLYAAQVAEKDAQVGKHRSQAELLEMVMEARIREATDDLRRKAKILRSGLDAAREQIAAATEKLRAAVEGLEAPEEAKARLLTLLSELDAAGASPAGR